MAIAIKEYLGNEGIQVDWNPAVITQLSTSEALHASEDTIKPDSLMVDIEGIHVGPTRNYTWYTEQALNGSVPTWTRPYLRPLIMHHNEKDGRIIGRIRFVTYTDKNTRSGTGALLFTTNVPDKEGKEGIENGTLQTVSIGVIVHDARCSICGHNIAESGPCEHERGQKYDGKICYWMIYEMEAKELSYVIVPSDIYAHNVKIYRPSKSELKENKKEGVLDLSEATKIDPVTGLPIQEGAPIIVEDGDKKDGEPTPVPAPEAPVVDVAALKADLAKAEQKVKDQEKEIEDLKAAKQASDDAAKDASKKLDDANVLLTQVQKELKGAKDSLVLKEAAIIQANQLREAAENEMISLKAGVRTSLIEKVELLRTSLGKPVIAREDLEKRSDDSLNDAVKDLQEEMSKPVNVNLIEKVENPALIDENPEPTNVKEDKKTSNIDLQEGLQNILNNLFSAQNKY